MIYKQNKSNIMFCFVIICHYSLWLTAMWQIAFLNGLNFCSLRDQAGAPVVSQVMVHVCEEMSHVLTFHSVCFDANSHTQTRSPCTFILSVTSTYFEKVKGGYSISAVSEWHFQSDRWLVHTQNTDRRSGMRTQSLKPHCWEPLLTNDETSEMNKYDVNWLHTDNGISTMNVLRLTSRQAIFFLSHFAERPEKK